MSALVIVPDSLNDALNAAVTKAIQEANVPEDQRAGVRHNAYHQLLAYYDQHGEIPEFSLVPKNQPTP